MVEDTDTRTNEQIVYDLGRAHITHNPAVAKLAVLFEAPPWAWMAEWERAAFDSLAPAVAWRYYRLGVDRGPIPVPLRRAPRLRGRGHVAY